MITAATGVVLAADESRVTPGVLGFIVVALLGVATWLLIRSMTRQLRKIDFQEPADEPSSVDRATDADGTARDGTARDGTAMDGDGAGPAEPSDR